jgi:hypothetical protein
MRHLDLGLCASRRGGHGRKRRGEGLGRGTAPEPKRGTHDTAVCPPFRLFRGVGEPPRREDRTILLSGPPSCGVSPPAPRASRPGSLPTGRLYPCASLAPPTWGNGNTPRASVSPCVSAAPARAASRRTAPSPVLPAPLRGANEFAAGTSRSPPSRTRRPGGMRRPTPPRVRSRDPRPFSLPHAVCGRGWVSSANPGEGPDGPPPLPQ